MRAALLVAMLWPDAALAHGGNPAEAKLTAPPAVGTVADSAFTVTWIDTDRPIPTGTATIDLYFVDRMPPTFFLGAIPDTITGIPIASGIPEYETSNARVWDLSAVPSGTYWIWSRVNDPPEPIPSPIYLSFSPAPLHVQHPGDPIGPAIRVTRPNTEISYSDLEYELAWEAFAPNGPATIRIEVGRSTDGSDFTVLADGLTATSSGSYTWDTSEVEEADWTIRAVITDETGSFTAYGRFFLLVTHFFPGRDGGSLDSGAKRDASALRDAAPIGPEPAVEDEGCGCTTSRSARSSPSLLPLLLLLMPRRRRGS